MNTLVSGEGDRRRGPNHPGGSGGRQSRVTECDGVSGGVDHLTGGGGSCAREGPGNGPQNGQDRSQDTQPDGPAEGGREEDHADVSVVALPALSASSTLRPYAPAMRPEPVPPARWSFPTDVEVIEAAAGDDELVATGADLDPSTLLAGYRAGLFPMPVGRRALGWWSPDPRGIVPLDGLTVARSLRRSLRRYEIRVDTAFDAVIDACADPRRPGAWINRSVAAAYRRLHQMGWAHSVEAWDDDGLAGGLYGVAIGGLFAGESMFHHRTDGSKVALVGLVERLRSGGGTLLDVQWATPHLVSLGAAAIPRRRYHELLADAIGRPQLVL